MPGKSRIDAPRALHHVIARDIERKKILQDDVDGVNSQSRLREILTETQTACFAWALDRVVNHLAEVLGMEFDQVLISGKYKRVVATRCIVCSWATRDLRIGRKVLAQKIQALSTCSQLRS